MDSPTRIISIRPNAGGLEGGTPVIITGEGFIRSGELAVLIGDAEAKVKQVSPTRVLAITGPSDAGIEDAVVTNPDGQKATLRDAFTYTLAPTIARVIPDNGKLSGGTRIVMHGSGFLPGAEVLISINEQTYRPALSVEVMSPGLINAVTPPGDPGPKRIAVRNPDGQVVALEEAFTYNLVPTITRITPNHGPSSGGSKIIIEGDGFLLGARVVIGESGATTMVRDDMTIEAVAPGVPQGVWDVRVINPDGQEAVQPRAFTSVGEVVYNYPNPFLASQGTTFRYVTRHPVQSVIVRIFNMAGRPIGVVKAVGSNEVRWYDPEVHAGLYIYVMEARLENGEVRGFKNLLEVYK